MCDLFRSINFVLCFIARRCLSPSSTPLLSFLAVGRTVLWALRRPALPRASRGPQPGTEPRQGRPQSLGSGRVTLTLCPSARTRVAVLRKGPIEGPGPRGPCPGQQGRPRHPPSPPAPQNRAHRPLVGALWWERRAGKPSLGAVGAGRASGLQGPRVASTQLCTFSQGRVAAQKESVAPQVVSVPGSGGEQGLR